MTCRVRSGSAWHPLERPVLSESGHLTPVANLKVRDNGAWVPCMPEPGVAPLSITAPAFDRVRPGGVAMGKATASNVVGAVSWSVSGPDWITIASDGTVTARPGMDVPTVFHGYDYLVRAADSRGSMATAYGTALVTTQGLPDLIVMAPLQFSVARGQTAAGRATALNAFGGVTYSKEAGPSWITIAADGTVTANPTGGILPQVGYYQVRGVDARGGTLAGDPGVDVALGSVIVTQPAPDPDPPDPPDPPITPAPTITAPDFSVQAGRSASQPVTFTGSGASVAKTAGESWISYAGGAVTASPGAGVTPSDYAYTLEVRDDQGRTARSSGTVTVTAAPVSFAVGVDDFSVQAGSFASASASFVPPGAEPVWSLVNPPAWVTLETDGGNTLGVVEARPPANLTPDDYSVTIRGTRGVDSDDHAFTITVTAAPVPDLGVMAPSFSVQACGSATGSFPVTNNVGAVTFRKTAGPDWFTILARGVFAAEVPVSIMPGQYAYSVEAVDSRGGDAGTATADGTVTVTAAPPAPTVTAPSFAVRSGRTNSEPVTFGGRGASVRKTGGEAWITLGLVNGNPVVTADAGSQTGTADDVTPGDYEYTLEARDSCGRTVESTGTVVVEAIPPSFAVSVPNITVQAGGFASASASFVPPGDEPTWSLVEPPSWVSLEDDGEGNTLGVVEARPPANLTPDDYSVTLRGVRGADSDDFIFTITVTPPPALATPGVPRLIRAFSTTAFAQVTPVTGAVRYRWVLSTDSIRGAGDVETTSASTVHVLHSLTGATDYWLFVRAENATGGVSAYSAALKFRTA